MKRAVAQLEQYLDKLEGYTKGTVVLATVFGDVHDIGKSLVNTILTNNGYTVVDLGKQVPIGTILDAAQEHEATAIGLSALLVSTSKQMPLAVQELHEHGLEYPLLIGGAAINRKFGLRALYPDGKESDDVYEPGVFYCKDAFEGLAVMDKLVDARARASELVEQDPRGRRASCARAARSEEVLDTTDDSVRSAARTDNPVPEPPFWGVREIEVDLDEVYPHLDTHVLFKLHWGGRGVKGEAWREAARRGLPPAAGAHVARAGLPAPARAARLLPLLLGGQRDRRARPRGPRDRARAAHTPAPAQGRPDLRWPTSSARRTAGELDVVALQAVTAGDEVTELMARLEPDGEFAEQLFTHGLGVQTAEGMAEWLHWRVRDGPRHPGHARAAATPGATRRCPSSPSTRRSTALLGLERIGMRLSGGYAVEPEQSTLALVAHHPQAVYFGMRNGRLLPDGSPDDVIKGTARDPSRREDAATA